VELVFDPVQSYLEFVLGRDEGELGKRTSDQILPFADLEQAGNASRTSLSKVFGQPFEVHPVGRDASKLSIDHVSMRGHQESEPEPHQW
jgi:hypothetical protein